MLIKEQIIHMDELHMYISLLKTNKQLKTNNYEEILSKLKDCFNVVITEEQLNDYFSPNLNELIEDSKLIYKNLGLC